MPLERQLAFKDRFVKELTQVLEMGDCSGSPLVLSEGVNTIILDLTEEQFIKIHSALMTGADLSYPSEAHQVVWWFTKGVTCAVDFCQRMIDCFENSEATREAMILAFISELTSDAELQQAFIDAMGQIGIGGAGGTSNTGSPNDGILGQLYDNSCAENVLYGKCFSAVDALNRISEDVLQVIEVLTNPSELVAEVADNIPAVGALVASVTDVANWLQDNVAENYLGAYNTSVQEFWACKIFCDALLDDCTLTFGRIRNVYRAELASYAIPSSTSDLATMLEWFITLLSLSDELLVGAMHLFCLEIMARAGTIYGNNFRAIEIALETASPLTPDCSECETWCKEWDLTAENPLIAHAGRPISWVSGTGYVAQQYTAFGNRYNNVSARLEFTSLADITHIEIDYVNTVNQLSAGGQNSIEGNDYNTGETPTTHATTYTQSWDGNVNDDLMVIQIFGGSKTGTGAFSGSNAGSATVTRLLIRGTGTNPFGADNC